MPRVCSLLHCQSKKPLNGAFHRLPRDPATRKVWLDAIGEENLCKDTKQIFICSSHFEDILINRTLEVIRLKDDAIPSLFLQPNTAASQNQERSKKKVRPKKNVCAVVQCPNSKESTKRNGVTFFRLPKDTDIRYTWIKALKIRRWNSEKICSEHFQESSFYETKYGQRLHSNAVPVIKLDPAVPASLMICRICLVHHKDMYNIREYSQAFEQIISISANQGESSRLPQCLCWECAARLTAAASFRAKALLSDGLLRDLLKPDKFMRIRDIKTINRKHYGLNTSLIQRHFDSNHFDYHVNDTFAAADYNIDLCENDFQTQTDDAQAETDVSETEINEEHFNESGNIEPDESSLDDITEQTSDAPKAMESDDNQIILKTNSNVNKTEIVTHIDLKDDCKDIKMNMLPRIILKKIPIDMKTEKVTHIDLRNDPKEDKINTVPHINLNMVPKVYKTEILPQIIMKNNPTDQSKEIPHIILKNDPATEKYPMITENPVKKVSHLIVKKNPDGKETRKVTHIILKNNPIIEKVTTVKKNINGNQTKKVTQILMKNNPSDNVTVNIDHNYSNIINTSNVKTEENAKRNIGDFESMKDESVLSDNNELDTETVNSPEEEDKEDVNMNVGNWNIEVEKRSKTLAIVPLGLTNTNKQTKVTPTRTRKRKLDETSTLKKKLKEGTTVTAVTKNYVRPKHNIRTKAFDEEIMKVTNLTYEEQVLEIELRQESPAYIDAPLKCTVCYTGFNNNDVFDRHMIKHSEKLGPLECIICKVRQRDKIRMSKHMTTHHSKEYKCQKCPFVTRFRQIAKKHVNYHAGRKFECQQCGAVFDKPSSFFGHRRLYHMTDEPCELCGYTFISKLGVRAHKARQHTLDKDKEVALKGPYCKKCDVMFYNDEAYNRHLRCSAKHLKNENDPQRIRNEPLNIPLMKVPRIKIKRKKKDIDYSTPARGPYTCEQCGKVLKNHMLYSLHYMRAHPDQRPFQHPQEKMDWMCDYCARFFRSKQGLEKHLLIHTGEMYECDYCGQKFIHKLSIEGHIQTIHLQNYSSDNKCFLCDKVYTMSRNLKKHLDTHMVEKPYECEFCLKRFSVTDGLRSHVRHIHFKIPWPKKRRKVLKEEAHEGGILKEEADEGEILKEEADEGKS